MTNLREAAQMALDALENNCLGTPRREVQDALRAALAQPEPEKKHALICPKCKADRLKVDCQGDRMQCGLMGTAYTAPPQREWQGLTDEEIEDACWTEVDQRLRSFTRAIEAKLKEKNT